MGEKSGTRFRVDVVKRSVVNAIQPLAEDAKLADVIKMVNALYMAVAPGKPSPTILPATVATNLAADIKKHEKRIKDIGK